MQDPWLENNPFGINSYYNDFVRILAYSINNECMMVITF